MTILAYALSTQELLMFVDQGKKKKKTFPQTPKNIISYDKMRPLDVFSNIFLFVCLFSSRETFFFFFPYILILGYNKDSYIAFELLHFKNAT